MRALSVAVGLLAATLSLPAAAQDYPTKPVTLVVPYAPGGNVDVSTRILQKALGDSLGQPLVVENRPGGGGMIAGSYVARAEPDGHTLFVASNGPILFGPMTSENPPYTWHEAFEPISSLALASNMMLVRDSFPAQTVEEFVKYAKENAGGVTVAISSRVSINHFLGLLLREKAGIEWTEVYYNGNAPAITDLVAEQVDAGFQQLVDSFQHIESGRLRALAVAGPKRVEVLPDVPTMAEAGYDGVEGITFNGVFAPKGTPQEVIDFLSEKIREALAKAEPKEQYAALGSVAPGSTPDEFREFLVNETEKWKDTVKPVEQ